MKNLTNEARSALLSARAKNRKAATALIAGGVELPKKQAKMMADLEAYYTSVLVPAAKTESEAA